jgi:carbon-monoxide dehydrogenase medium subunit
MNFDWIEPRTIAEVLQAQNEYGDTAKIIAGGTWVTLVLNQGLLYPSALISLRYVPGLTQITHDATKGLAIGAMVTHRAMETDPLVRTHYPMLAETFGVVANVRIRNQATAGGCVCDADYASDAHSTGRNGTFAKRVRSAQGNGTGFHHRPLRNLYSDG